jgi:hypothetical protein
MFGDNLRECGQLMNGHGDWNVMTPRVGVPAQAVCSGS